MTHGSTQCPLYRHDCRSTSDGAFKWFQVGSKRNVLMKLSVGPLINTGFFFFIPLSYFDRFTCIDEFPIVIYIDMVRYRLY